MARFRVTCTVKADKDERILSVGCFSPTNLYSSFTEAELIAKIECRTDSFYVERPTGHVVDLIVAEREGKKYVKTVADGEKPDNLLSLPTCSETKQEPKLAGRVVVGAASHGGC